MRKSSMLLKPVSFTPEEIRSLRCWQISCVSTAYVLFPLPGLQFPRIAPIVEEVSAMFHLVVKDIEQHFASVEVSRSA